MKHIGRVLSLMGLLGGAALAADPPHARPNILFAIADDWSHPHAGALGLAWVKTPAFDRVAREGVLFRNAYTPNAKCAPSRSTLLTGRNPWQLGAGCNHICEFPSEFRTWAEALGAHGYFVGMTGKGWGPGSALDASGKPRAMAGRPFNRRRLEPPTRDISNNDYAANFSDFLEAAPAGKPWCFWYGATEPHRSYAFGSGAKRGGKDPRAIERVPAYLPDDDITRNDLLDHALEVEHFDTHLGRMLEELAKRGALANTLVVVTADNGMPFPRAKGNAYEISTHMPLAVMWPQGIDAPGRAVDDFVSFVDIAPTFLGVSGLSALEAGMAPVTGRSLLPILQSDRSGWVDQTRDHVLLGQERHDVGRPRDWGYPIRGIVTDGWLYLHNYEPDRWPAGNPETGYLNTDASPSKTFVLDARRARGDDPFWALCFGKRPRAELYDLRVDPDCVTNLAARPEQGERVRALERRLVERLMGQGDPRMFGNGGIFEAFPFANPALRDFHARYLRGEKLEANWVLPTDFEKTPLDSTNSRPGRGPTP